MDSKNFLILGLGDYPYSIIYRQIHDSLMADCFNKIIYYPLELPFIRKQPGDLLLFAIYFNILRGFCEMPCLHYT